MELADRWPLQGAEDVRDRLLEAYGDASRGYHDQRHLTEVLDRFDELAVAGETFARLPVALAAWFHDAVYAGAPDDEERSARLAARARRGGGPADVVAEVVRLVLVTAEHRPEDGDLDGAALSDADLGILAADPTRYAEYVASVRREYAHVGDDDFRAGRRAVLDGAGREAGPLPHRCGTGAVGGRGPRQPPARARPPGLRAGGGPVRRGQRRVRSKESVAGAGVEPRVDAERDAWLPDTWPTGSPVTIGTPRGARRSCRSASASPGSPQPVKSPRATARTSSNQPERSSWVT